VQRTFQLSSLLLTVTWIAVCLGVALHSIGLGIALAVVGTPAMARTAVAAVRRKAAGRPMDVQEKLAAFAGSLGVVVAIGVAAGGTFFAMCWAGFFGGAMLGEAAGAKHYEPLGWGIVGGLALGTIAGLIVAFLVIRRLWPQRRR